MGAAWRKNAVVENAVIEKIKLDLNFSIIRNYIQIEVTAIHTHHFSAKRQYPLFIIYLYRTCVTTFHEAFPSS